MADYSYPHRWPCSAYRENGRIYVEGYHGQKALDFGAGPDQALMKKVAVFSALGANLSECCVPAIKMTPTALMQQLTNNTPQILEAPLTTDFSGVGIADDFMIISETDTGALGEADFLNAFQQFFQNTAVFGMNVQFQVGVSPFQPYIATIQTNFTGYNNAALGTFLLTSTPFSVEEPGGTISFTLGGQNPTIVYGDSIIKISQLPTFTVEDFTPNTAFPADAMLRISQQFLISAQINTLTTFISTTTDAPI